MQHYEAAELGAAWNARRAICFDDPNGLMYQIKVDRDGCLKLKVWLNLYNDFETWVQEPVMGRPMRTGDEEMEKRMLVG